MNLGPRSLVESQALLRNGDVLPCKVWLWETGVTGLDQAMSGDNTTLNSTSAQATTSPRTGHGCGHFFSNGPLGRKQQIILTNLRSGPGGG